MLICWIKQSSSCLQQYFTVDYKCFTESYVCGWPCNGKVVSEADRKHPTGEEGHGNETSPTWSFLPVSRSLLKFHQFDLAKTNYETVRGEPDGQSDKDIDRHSTWKQKHTTLFRASSISVQSFFVSALPTSFFHLTLLICCRFALTQRFLWQSLSSTFEKYMHGLTFI